MISSTIFVSLYAISLERNSRPEIGKDFSCSFTQGYYMIHRRSGTISAVLLHSRMKIYNTEGKIKTRIVETFGPLSGKNEVFRGGAINKSIPFGECHSIRFVTTLSQQLTTRSYILQQQYIFF